MTGQDVFISYSRSDGMAYALALREALKTHRVSVFLDEEELEAGAALSPRLRSAARSSSLFAVLLTPGALERSRWIDHELRCAETSWLPSTVVPLVFPPIVVGTLPAPLDRLNGTRMLPETAPVPSEAVLKEFLRTLGRRRLRRRRRTVAILVLGAVLAVIAALVVRSVRAGRALAAQRWIAAADRAASSGRFDVAEYAVARAVETEPGLKVEYTDRYQTFRAHRIVAPAGGFALSPAERVVLVGSFGGKPTAVVTGNGATHLTGTDGALSPRAIVCTDVDRALQCSAGTITLICGQELIGVGASGAEIRRTLEGSVEDAGCIDGELRIVEVSTAGQLRLLHLTSDAVGELAAPEPYLSEHSWMDAGLCRESWARFFGARSVEGGVTLERGGVRRDGGLGAIRDRFDVPGLVAATVVAAADCERFFIEYSTSEGAGSLPAIRPTASQWAMHEWDGSDRELPSSIKTLFPLPKETGLYAIYLATSGDIALVPVVDRVVLALEPHIAATGASALAMWRPRGTAPSRALTVSVEGSDVVVRDGGVMLVRRPARVLRPSRIVAGDGDVFLVEGDGVASFWQGVSPGTTQEVQASAAVARDLGVDPSEVASLETQAAP